MELEFGLFHKIKGRGEEKLGMQRNPKEWSD